MKVTDEELMQMLNAWGESEAKRLGLDVPMVPEPARDPKVVPFIVSTEAVAPTSNRPAAAPRPTMWRAVGTSALAACAVSALMLWWFMPSSSTTPDYAPRGLALKEGQSRLTATAGFAKGWRRAGMVVSVSDYAGFRATHLPDLELAALDAASARRVMETQMHAPRENILALSNRSASEVAVMSGVHWLRQFNRASDLIVLHFACHGLVGPDGRLRFVMDDSRDAAGKVTGLAADELMRELESLPGIVIMVADTCHSGALAQVKLGARQAIVASAGEEELALDSVFGRAWLGGMETGKADTNLDGAVTLQEAFDHVLLEFAKPHGEQRPQLLLGSAGLANDAVLGLHPQLSALLPEAGAALPAPGVLEFTPDGPCEVWLGTNRLGTCSAPVALVTGPGVQRLRALREEWGAQRSEWIDPAPQAVPPGKRLQRTAVFSAPRRTATGQLRLLETKATGLDHNPFPQRQAYGDVTVRSEQLPDGRLAVQLPNARRTANAGLVMLANDAVTGVNLTSLLGVAKDGFVRLTISAKVETGRVQARCFVGGRVSESLSTRLEVTTQLDDQWQTITLKLPASQADGIVTGFGIEFGPSDTGGEKIFVRDVTFSR